MDLTFPGTERKTMTLHSPLQQVRAYWEGLRDGTALPRREAIDPRGLSGALEQVFLIERVAPGIARLRLAGAQLQEVLGMEVRGMPLFALFEPAARARLGQALEGLFTAPAVLDLWLEAERGIGRPALRGRMLLLPVCGNRDEPGLALGCLCIEGQIGRCPRRFAISGLAEEPLAMPQTAPAEPLPGLAEAPPVPFVPAPPRSRPALRLVHSRD